MENRRLTLQEATDILLKSTQKKPRETRSLPPIFNPLELQVLLAACREKAKKVTIRGKVLKLTHSVNTFFNSEPPQEYVHFMPEKVAGQIVHFTPRGWYRVSMIEEELQVAND